MVILKIRAAFIAILVSFFAAVFQTQAAEIKMAIQPQYDAAGLFYDGIAPVKIDEQWGFIKPDGSWAIEPQYKDVKPYRGGGVVFSDGIAWGLADKVGKVIIEPRFPDMTSVSEGVLGLQDASGKWAMAKVDGFRFTGFLYDTPPEAAEGKATVKKDGVWGFVDVKGTADFTPVKGVDKLFNLSDGRAAFIKGKLRGFVDASGSVVIKPQFKSVRAFSEGYAAVQKDFSGEWLWSLIAKDGADVFSSEPYFGLRDYADDVAPAKTLPDDGKWIYVDIDGYGLNEWEYGFEAAYSFREGFALVKKGGAFGFLNKDGKYASDDRFEDAYSFNEGMAPVMKGGKWGYVALSTNNMIAEVKSAAEKEDASSALEMIKGLANDNIRNLTRQAEQGDLSAAAHLSGIYYEGISVDQNLERAFYWEKYVADQPYEDIINTGNLQKDSIANLSPNYHNLMVNQAKKGLAYKYIEGEGVQRNVDMAIRYLSDSANNGYADSAYVLGTLYTTGQSVQVNHDIALGWYLRAAELGDTTAAFNAGWELFTGKKVKRNLQRGLALLEKAAENGSDSAAQNLGLVYRKGYDGVEADIDESKKWYEVCSLRDNKECQLSLAGAIYDNTNIVSEAEVALSWALISKENGNNDAQRAIDIISSSLTTESQLKASNNIIALKEKIKNR